MYFSINFVSPSISIFKSANFNYSLDYIYLSESDPCDCVNFHSISKTLCSISWYICGLAFFNTTNKARKDLNQERVLNQCKWIRKIICYFKYGNLIWLQSNTCTWKQMQLCHTLVFCILFCNYWENYCTGCKQNELSAKTSTCLCWFFTFLFQMFWNSEKWRSQSMTLQISWWF